MRLIETVEALILASPDSRERRNAESALALYKHNMRTRRAGGRRTFGHNEPWRGRFVQLVLERHSKGDSLRTIRSHVIADLGIKPSVPTIARIVNEHTGAEDLGL